MSWMTYAIISTLCFSFYGLLGRVLVLGSNEPRAFSAVYNLLAGFFVLTFFVFDKFEMQKIPPSIILLTIAMIFVYGIFNRTEYIAKKHMEASLFAVVAKLATIFTFLLSIVFFRESITFNKILAAVFIIGANFMIFFRNGNFKIDKGLKYALIMSFFLGIGWTIDKKAAAYWPLPLYAFMGYVFSNIFVVYFPVVPFRKIIDEFKRTGWKVILLSSSAASGYYFLIKAFTLGEASKVVLINAVNSLITIILAIIFLKERKNILLKLFAGLLAFTGIILLK